MEIGGEGLDPVSPTGHYFNSSVLSISILGVLEFEIPIDDSQTLSLLENVFLPINSRFSSIIIENNGKKQWKKVEVKLEDHVKSPIFPSNLSNESYDKYFDDYISNIATTRFPEDKPLWEIHVIKYPNSNAAGNVIFKLHHALGDGYSLMGALISCLRRADNPSLPLTFPSRLPSKPKSENVMTTTFSCLLNTISDSWWGISKSIMGEDDRSPIKSANNGLEFAPITVSTMTISLDLIRLIKSRLGVAASRYIRSTIKNSSMVITNMIGPLEQMSLANHPIKGLYFLVVGTPQDLDISIVSYMGKVKLAFTMKKGIIDPQKLKLCMENALDMIFNASDRNYMQNSTEEQSHV
ncbi:wax ester synthase/diacylglycerol acyltransferase 11-like isoform X2 [Malus domestica]|uniref:wax ester synthase/diacylglycerol acyltransferase 11-like isoform X2 n=1 Tax=Malus domestica TaxID=3750 RepID=UPI0039771B82